VTRRMEAERCSESLGSGVQGLRLGLGVRVNP